ncbi:RIO1 family-domain-containing protein [Naematelia encephala]|uniref:non-specific serine/threonine protein kinase n=1 Tax=Naematelia encephala TaxID=71784 RepID=A0A1Y2B7X9_9TREE|nr:RIO1 family-domain-containing protein [Naematelia encephala]
MADNSTIPHSTRPHGSAYIDQTPDPGFNSAEHDILNNVSSIPSGSSTEEDSDDGSSVDWSGDDLGPSKHQASDSYLSPDSGRGEGDFDDDEWMVENEDWELAQGDFTKQYNRARQQHSAVYTGIRPSSEIAAGPSGSSRPPLPARNVQRAKPTLSPTGRVRLALNTGVAVNPKVVGVGKDKSDRATLDQVLDARTRLVLGSLKRRGIIDDIEYCISTGKEANVYYSGRPALSTDSASPSALAVKIYRTSILAFRSRKSYIEGEHRFKGEYTSSKNPRKMVRVWAEKELRNLRRLHQGGIRVPIAIEQKENVLVMEFLATGESASPRLKDAELSQEDVARLYSELIVIMRRMFKHCKLVHADLSEYNILLHDSHICIIDVSQSVEHDHPRSFDFLRKDIHNVHDYFTRLSRGDIGLLSLRRTWDFVTLDDIGLSREQELGEEGEKRMSQILYEWLSRAVEPENQLEDDTVFMTSFIPRHLGEVADPERDVDLLQSGNAHQLIYAQMQGLALRPKLAQADATTTTDNSSPTGDAEPNGDSDDSDDSGNDESGSDLANRRSRGFRHEDKELKKVSAVLEIGKKLC